MLFTTWKLTKQLAKLLNHEPRVKIEVYLKIDFNTKLWKHNFFLNSIIRLKYSPIGLAIMKLLNINFGFSNSLLYTNLCIFFIFETRNQE